MAAALTGGAAGAVASLIAPWSQWGVEKRRAKLQRRTDLIASWRQMLAEHAKGELNRNYLEDERYQTLRPYLSPEILKKVEPSPNYITIIKDAPGGIAAKYEIEILDREVTRVQKEWKLL